MIKLNYLATIRFSGPDAGSFLHNQLSADILGLADGAATFACYCEPKGRVLALVLVSRAGGDYFAIMSAELAEGVANRLLIYRLRSKAEISVLKDHAVLGLTAGEPAPPGGAGKTTITLPDKTRCLSVVTADTPVDEDASQREAWKYAELQMGICWLNQATSGEFLPQMLGFEQLGAVNYRKGCYPGQEIVARTRYLGKVKRHPRLLDCILSACPAPMEKVNILTQDLPHEAVVVDCACGPNGQRRLFAVTRLEPELPAAMIEYGDETVPLLPSG